MDSFEIHARAKINIGLLIKGKREDGYHLLETLLYPIELADTLTFLRREEEGFEINISGLDEKLLTEQNLCHKAWKLVNQDFPEVNGLHLDLSKKIPAGAGLGGGSSDAAKTILALNEIFSLGLDFEKMSEYASKLGADVPFFLHDRPMMATGIGQDLEPFDLREEFEVQLFLPEIHSSTVKAYQGLDLTACDPDRNLVDLLSSPMAEWKESVTNDLEAPVFREYPEIQRIKQECYDKGAVYASMSGSGSSVYTLVKNY